LLISISLEFYHDSRPIARNNLLLISYLFERIKADRDANIYSVHVFYYLTIFVMSHMGRKIARAKNPTTAAKPTIRMGPIISDRDLTA
jgi:hypothetical protein